MASNLGTAYIEILPSTDKLVPGVKRALGSETSGPLAREGKRGGGILAGALGTSLKVVGGAAVGVAAAGIGMAFTKGLDRHMKIENAEKKLAALGNSAKDVQKIMSGALAAVKGTSFGLGDAADVAASAVASGIKPGKQLDQTLKTIVNTAAIAGTDMASMGAIFNKVAAQGKIQGDELAQLGNRGVPALQWLSKELGVSSSEVAKLASKGKIDFATFERAMRKGMAPDAAVQMGDTLSGTWENLGASLGRLGAGVMKKAGPAIKTGMKQATEAVDSLTQKLGPALDKVADVADGAFRAINDFLAGFSAENIAEHEWFVDALHAIDEALFEVEESVGGFWETVQPILAEVWDFLVQKWGEIAPAVERTFGTAMAVVEKALKIISAIVRRVTGEIKAIWDRWGKTILGIVDGLMVGVVGIFEGAFKIVEGIFDVAYALLTGDTEGVKAGLLTIFEGIKTGILGIVEGMLRMLGSIWGGIKPLFSGPVNWVISNVINPLVDQINRVAEAFGASWRAPRMRLLLPGGPGDRSPKAASTGTNRAMAEGGRVGGHSPHPKADNILTWLTAGEEVIRVDAAQRLRRNHPGLLEYLNRTGELPPQYAPHGYAEGGRIIPNARQGFGNYNAMFLGAIQAWARATGRTWYMTGNGGARSFADQKRAWDLYQAGLGPLAANPYKGGPHMVPGRAMDLSPRPGEIPSAAALLSRYGLGLTVRGEPWHVGWAGGKLGSAVTGADGKGWDPLAAAAGLLSKAIPYRGGVAEMLKGLPRKLFDMGKAALGFDSGGMLPPGIHTVVNASGRPEPVLTADQWDAFERSIGGVSAEEIRAALEGLRLGVDLDNGEAWFTGHYDARQTVDLRRQRATTG